MPAPLFSIKIDTFRNLARGSIFGRILVVLLAPFGSILKPMGARWLHFGPPWAPFGSIFDPLAALLLHLGLLWAPFASIFIPFGTLWRYFPYFFAPLGALTAILDGISNFLLIFNVSTRILPKMLPKTIQKITNRSENLCL